MTVQPHNPADYSGRRFRLPDWLGGHEFANPQEELREGRCHLVSGLVTQGSTTWVIHIGPEALVELPPLAPEPCSGSAAATHDSVWLRCYKGWFDGFPADDAEGIEILTWAQLNSRHPEVKQLVYDAFASAPQWVNGDAGIHIGRSPDTENGHRLVVGEVYADLGEEQWESLAASMLRGARADGEVSLS